jgi:hypothetical protein
MQGPKPLGLTTAMHDILTPCTLLLKETMEPFKNLLYFVDDACVLCGRQASTQRGSLI